MFGAWFLSFFAWPSGGIWSNLLASLILWLPTLRHLRRRARRAEAKSSEDHAEIVQLHADAAAQRVTHHTELKRHLGIGDDSGD